MKKGRVLLKGGALLLTLAAVFWLVAQIPALVRRGIAPGPQHDGRPLAEWSRDLGSDEPAVRREAVVAIGSMGPDAAPAVHAVCAMLEDPSATVRANAAMALAKMYPASRGTAPQLARALKDPRSVVRAYATIALCRLGPDALPAVPALLEALRDRDNEGPAYGFTWSVREGAVRVLGRIAEGPEEVVAALGEALGDGDPGVRAAAAESLGRIGPGAAAAAPRLRAARTDADARVRDSARQALRLIEGPAEGR